jgi:hypothetical protein
MAREAVKLTQYRRDNRRTRQFAIIESSKKPRLIGNEAATYCLKYQAASSILWCSIADRSGNGQANIQKDHLFMRRK